MVWEGLYFVNTGYAQAARQYLLALDDLGVEVTAKPVDGPTGRADGSLPDRQRVEHLCCRQPRLSELRVHHVMPPAFSLEKDACANVGYTVFETDRLPRGWVPRCNMMDEVWVPSSFCVDRFAAAGVNNAKLHVIPHGVAVERYRPDVSGLRIEGARGYIFLSIFYWSKRKGWDVLLRAYLAEFRGSDDVSLVIRAQGLDHAELTELLSSARPSGKGPTVVVLPFSVPDSVLPSLYAAADAFVVPARGEGWGMPYSEAMAAGLPTIATNWGGHLDFMDHENAYLVEVEAMTPIDEWMQRVTGAEPDHLWAEPSIDHLRQLMRELYENPEAGRAKGRAARESLVRGFTWRHAALKICERAEALGEFHAIG
jgi:glycosyltransferase involved in cell wall biosynthesis